MNTFTTVTYNVLAQSHVHPDRYPLSRPEALDPARRRVLLPDRVAGLDADLLCLQEVEPAVHDGLPARLDGELPSLAEPSDHLPLRVDLA